MMADSKPIISMGTMDVIDLSRGCPDCGCACFYPGPRGGMSVNVKCAMCGACFCYCGPLPAHRIEEVPGVYSSVHRTIEAIS